MKVALAQINTTVGDFDGNLLKVTGALERGRSAGADLVVFPEQAIPGYPAEDLLEREDFLDAVEVTLEKAVAACRGIAMVIGTVVRAEDGDGKPVYNSAALVDDGRLIGFQHKTLLPTYDVFDEGRYFRPAPERRVFSFKGRTVGLLICEDLWNDPSFWPQRRYQKDPVEELVHLGADCLVAISASPFSIDRLRFRYEMFRNMVTRFEVDLVYCNLVGGNTSLVFDGASFAVDSHGRVRALSAGFEEDFCIFDLDAVAPKRLPEALRPDARPVGRKGGKAPEFSERALAEAFRALVLGTRDYLQKTGFSRAVVGLSGGIDSALTATIAVEALGRENVLGVAMPSRYSSEGSVRDAERLATNMGIDFHKVPIERIFKATLETLEPVFDGLPQDVTEENIQARSRGLILMALSNKLGALLLTTGNKSELAVGYCTLYGDMSGGLAVISDVPKLLVYELARWVNRDGEVIPKATIEKPPSAELRPGQKDQDTLPAYEILDPILEAYIEDKMSVEEIAAAGFDREVVHEVIRKVDRNEYKRKQAAPGLRVTAKAFGGGRRFPLVEKFRV